MQRILDIARWAPSAHNAQPWRFILVKDKKQKVKLAKAMATEWDKDLVNDGISSLKREELLKSSILILTKAPELVVTCLTMENMDKYPDLPRRKAEHALAIQSVAAANLSMILAAHAEGLGTCWFCAPLFCQRTVRTVLGLPKSFAPQSLILLGYSEETPVAPPRKPLSSLVRINRWEV